MAVHNRHHLGPRPLNLIKTILNKTQTVIVLSAMDTLFRRLEMNAFEEAILTVPTGDGERRYGVKLTTWWT